MVNSFILFFSYRFGIKIVCIIHVLQKLSSTADASKEQYGLNVAPLDVPELLENLVRQSEPLLDHLGVKKGAFLSISLSLSLTRGFIFSGNG